jgi:ssDNA-binding Zn-finger/Zn-ribbon topoisomerase 1
MVKVTCLKCHWSWSLNSDEIKSVLDTLGPEDAYYAVECPKCRRINKITRKQLEHALPPQGAEPKAEAAPPAEEQ